MHVRLLVASAVTVLIFGATPDPVRTLLTHPPSLRPGAQGRVLFADEFHDPSLSLWRADRERTWSVHDGRLRADLPESESERAFLRPLTELSTDYAIDVDVRGVRHVHKILVLLAGGERGVGLDVRGAGHRSAPLRHGEVALAETPIAHGNGAFSHLRIEVRGKHVRVIVNGELRVDRDVPDEHHADVVLAARAAGARSAVDFDNFVVSALE